ncbi:glycine-rich protein DOT1-like [Cryptomeria japonica]|uniref:glycine-rich protein DOT1-like n=1 Tax=Cryptomeria japonica TaxID=3369 RepID=UPI0025ABD6A1|nr:glycine-rich protein DOT1-like [Cryptomeria japonica]
MGGGRVAPRWLGGGQPEKEARWRLENEVARIGGGGHGGAPVVEELGGGGGAVEGTSGYRARTNGGGQGGGPVVAVGATGNNRGSWRPGLSVGAGAQCGGRGSRRPGSRRLGLSWGPGAGGLAGAWEKMPVVLYGPATW